MILNFTTLFYANYAAKGIALCRSLIRVCKDYHIYVFAMDDDCYKLLQSLLLPNITILSLRELEDYYPALLIDKVNRNKGEYSWTCKGPSMLYCIEKYGLKDITYLDADLYFMKDPTPLYLESPNADVMLTSHRYTDAYNLAATNGQYCAGYLYFKATENGLNVLHWWTDLCIEWCYSSHEPGRFGDQKYLDLFHEKFDNVYDIKHIGFCAPWNIQQYKVREEDGRIKVKLADEEDNLIFYHFHFLKNQDMGIYNEINLGPYKYDMNTINLIYKPYMKEIEQIAMGCDIKNVKADVLASNICKMTLLRFLLHWIKNCWKPNKYIWKRR